MKLIKNLGSRHNGNRNYKWGLFECPMCLKRIERMLHQGRVQLRCPECSRKVHKESQIKHGGRYTRLYRTWVNMRSRCLNSNSQKFSNYGGKGITICNEWNSFETFRTWANANGYNDTLTIDRIDPKKHYEPSNCQWITNKENAGKDKYLQIGKKKKLSISKTMFLQIEELRKTKTLDTILKQFKTSDTAYRNAKKRYTKDIK